MAVGTNIDSEISESESQEDSREDLSDEEEYESESSQGSLCNIHEEIDQFSDQNTPNSSNLNIFPNQNRN